MHPNILHIDDDDRSVLHGYRPPLGPTTLRSGHLVPLRNSYDRNLAGEYPLRKRHVNLADWRGIERGLLQVVENSMLSAALL